MIDILEWLKPEYEVIATVAVIAACFSAIFSFRAAKQLRQNTQAQLMASLFDDYAAPSMLDALECLQKWAGEHEENFANEFARLWQVDDSQIREVNNSRRQVSQYYKKIYALWKIKFMKKQAIRMIISKDQIIFLRAIVEPLEAAINPNYERRISEKFGRLYGINKSSLLR